MTEAFFGGQEVGDSSLEKKSEHTFHSSNKISAKMIQIMSNKKISRVASVTKKAKQLNREELFEKIRKEGRSLTIKMVSKMKKEARKVKNAIKEKVSS